MEAVSCPCICNKKQGLRWVGLDFLSQAIDEYTKIFEFVSVVRSPHHLKQFPVSNRLVRPGQEIRKKCELSRRQTRGSVIYGYFPRGEIDVYTLCGERL
jgi:hypothetical protein